MHKDLNQFSQPKGNKFFIKKRDILENVQPNLAGTSQRVYPIDRKVALFVVNLEWGDFVAFSLKE